VAARQLGAAVARRSNGRLQIEVFPNSQLAKERESVQGLLSGTVDMTAQATPWIESFYPQMQVLTLPFLFKDSASAFRVADGPIGDELFAGLETKGITGLLWCGTSFREFESTGRPIKTPDDVKGLRFRVQSGAVYVGMATALGAIPVQIDYSELYTALSQKTIDLIDSTPDGLVSAKLQMVTKNLAMTNHVYNLNPLIASKKKLDELPSDLQRILREEIRAIRTSWRNRCDQQAAESLQALKSGGMTFTEIDHAAFQRAMEPVYAAAQTRVGGDLVQRLVRASNA
jgi:tripartite ATP-independent transporter DctP family solute receptor